MNQQAAAQRSDERIRLEQQLAGSVVYYSGTHKPYLAGDVLAVCNPGMFISPKAKAIMEGVQALTGRSEQVDIVTVGMEIQRRKKDGENLPIAGDEFAQYVNAATCISERSVMEAAHIIAGEWRKDMASVELGKAMQDMQAFAVPVDVPLAGIREAQAILDAAGGDKPVSLDARLDEYAANLAANDSRMRPVRSPWDNLNRILRGGILPKELAILAARPGVGKSALALNWAWSVACSGETAIFFSLEMGREQLLDRLVANRGGIDLGAFREGLTQEQRARVQSVIRDMRNKSLDIIDDTRITVGEVRRRVRIAQRAAVSVSRSA